MIYLFVSSFFIVFIISSNIKVNASIEDQIHKNIMNIQQSISNTLSTKPSFSSSPYTYIKDSKDFENIVALGNPALPVLKKMLDESNNNGLIEYIYAIAIEKISKVDIREETNWDNAKDFSQKYTTHLKKIPDQVDEISKEKISLDEKISKVDIREETNWDNAKDFSQKYTTHLKKIPDQVDEISKEKISLDEKNEKLKKLGTPAIPYIADKIEDGDKDLFPALDYLIDNKSKNNLTEWQGNYSEEYQLLKSFVEAAN